MGNCNSATSVKVSPKIKVVQSAQGRVLDMELPLSQSDTKVGELLLEFPPGHFLSQLQTPDFLSSTGKRAAPVGADAEAKPGTVYVLLPMPRLHTRITPQELLTFAKLLHLHDQQFTKGASLKSQVHRFFTAGARVAPLTEEEDRKDDNVHGVDSTEHEQAWGLLGVQQNEQEATLSSSFASLMSYGTQFQVIKSKPWAPKLETIQESGSL